MNKELVPQNLHHLIPLVEKWGIENEECRIEMIWNTLNKDLIEFMQSINDTDIDNLNQWLKNTNAYTDEYLKFRAFIDAYVYAYSLIKIDKNNVPEKLHHLIPLVQKWGIGDDGYRDEAVANANATELMELVSSISDEDAKKLNEWLSDPYEIKICTQEYLMYSTFFMAYEYANAVLKSNRK